MAEVHIRIADLEPVKSLLASTSAVTRQWDDMTRCYIGAEENVRLAELLDDLCAAVQTVLGGAR